ncbi:MAG: RCC1 repeat-containing protein, partial [Actinomycetota bacterium]
MFEDGNVTCWGRDTDGQLGNGANGGADVVAPPATIALPSPGRARSITTGARHTCALLTDGAVTCWGANASGQVGNGDATGADVSSPSPPVALPGGATATAVTALGDATCALLLGGGVSCWGRNGDGEVGSGTVGGVVRTPAAAINLPESAVALAGGFRHACAVLQSGNVFCWGRDSLGQLGNGPASSADAPQYAGPDSLVALPPGRSARAVAAGSSHSCALLDNGAPICWGNDSNGQLGDDGGTGGSITEPALSAPLAGDAAAVALSGGGNNMCALATDGALQCWGSNASGQLGNGTPPGGNSPRPMPALRGFDDIFAEVGSGTAQTCAVLTDGGISCWGNDDSGALGAGTTREDVPSPNPAVALPAPGTASAVTGGTFFACALLTSGGVTCWGDDFEGALGNVGGAVSTPPAPVDLPAPGRAKQIDTGFLFTCALLVDGQVTCWGSGFFGALGNGTIGINALTPPPPIILPPPGAATAIAAGGRHACALLTDGRVSCWGDDTDGQLGN